MAKILPKYKIEVSFTASNSTGLSFTDISGDVRLYAGINISVGRSDQFADVQASTASFTVDNLSTTYTPGSGNVTRGRAVRISATEDSPASWTQIWYGFVDTITQAWDNQVGKMSNVVFTCVDLSTLLSRSQLADTLLNYYATAPGSPADWWPLNDAVGTKVPANVTGTTRVVAVNQGPGPDAVVTYQTDGIPYGDDGSHSAQLVQSSLTSTALTTTQYDPSVGFTLGCFFQLPNGAGSGTIDLVSLADSTFTNFAVLSVDNTGILTLTVAGWATVTLTIGTANVADGRWHHAAAVMDPALSRLKLYLDGGTPAQAVVVPGSVAMPITFLTQIITSNDTINLQHVMAWQSALTDAQVSNLGGLADGFTGETSVARVNRIAAVAGYTPTITGSPIVQSMAPWHDYTGSFWDMLTTVAKTEQGILYIDRTGAVAFRTRGAQFNQTAALTFGSGTYEDSLQFVQSPSNFWNQYTATAYGSSNPQTVTNQTSINNDGTWNDSATVETGSDNEALSYAQTHVSTTGIPLTRLPQLDVDLLTQQTLFASLLANFWVLDLGDLITVSSLPSQAVASSVSLFLQGFTTTLTESSYDATLNLADGQKTAWILQDATYGLLGSTTILS